MRLMTLGVVAASAATALSACGAGPSSRKTIAPPAPSPVAQELVASLVAAAHGKGKGDVRLFRNTTRNGHWILASATGDGELCFTLGLVGTTLESTCVTEAQRARHPLLVYSGDEPTPAGHGWDDYVVYGLVSHAVRALTVRLSDCTTLRVRLSTRPLFWAFVPDAKLARRVVPVGYVAHMGSRVVHDRLGSPPHPSGRCGVT